MRLRTVLLIPMYMLFLWWNIQIFIRLCELILISDETDEWWPSNEWRTVWVRRAFSFCPVSIWMIEILLQPKLWAVLGRINFKSVVNAKALSIMRYQDDINTEHKMKSIGVAQLTKSLIMTRNGQTRIRIREVHIFDITKVFSNH